MKNLIAIVSLFCLLLISLTTLAFWKNIKRVNSHSSGVIQSLAISMKGIDTHEFNRQHQPYLDYLSQK